jgi:transcriptional regulator GlxA family with amidase domain
VAPHRDGGQAQFVPVPVDSPDSQADLGAGTFARWFAARTGTTPHQWLTSQRLLRAQELLERTDRGIEQLAADCGLTPLMLRRHFARRWGITPQAYRRRFSQLAG